MHRYRPDIDGLRAVAIVPVLLFHAGVGAFSGGFVGVDVFFVISGFLITGLIRNEIDSGTFSIANFYERRIRRILPALFAVTIVTAALSAWLLLPDDLADFGKSVAATSLFASNFLFWQESGYFAPAAEETPLLHTWSLAVEEQFYILFPLFLAFVASRPARPYVAATVAVVVPSFLLSLAGVAFARDAAFYLAPFRAWELGLGALLALGVVRPSHDVRLRNGAALAGGAAIAWSVFQYSAGTAFPGAAALLPCVGAAAIIWAGSGGHNLVGDALSWRPVVLVGLVSYSLYLWHWPLLALGRYYAMRDLTAVETTVVLALAALAAVASWRYVERPFRGKSGILDRRQIFRTTVAVTGGAVALGLAAVAASGWPGRIDEGTQRVLAAGADHRSRDWKCGNADPSSVAEGTLCRIGDERAGAPSFLLWGDSHGRAAADAIDAAAGRAGRSGVLAVRTGCSPLPGVRRSDHDRGHRCEEFNQAVLDSLARTPRIEDVVLMGRWALLAEGRRYGREPGGAIYLADADSTARSSEDNRRIFDRSLDGAVSSLLAMGKRVWIVASVPEVGWDVPSTLARSVRFDRDPPLAPSPRAYAVRQTFVLDSLARLDARPGVVVLRPDAVMCGPDRCEVTRDGLPLYFDSHHLSRLGTQMLEPMFDEVFAR